MPTKLQKWGNSLAVRIPKKVVNRLGLKEGNVVAVDEYGAEIIIKKASSAARGTQKKDWKYFILPSNKKKEEVSGKIDKILYGKSS